MTFFVNWCHLLSLSFFLSFHSFVKDRSFDQIDTAVPFSVSFSLCDTLLINFALPVVLSDQCVLFFDLLVVCYSLMFDDVSGWYACWPALYWLRAQRIFTFRGMLLLKYCYVLWISFPYILLKYLINWKDCFWSWGIVLENKVGSWELWWVLKWLLAVAFDFSYLYIRSYLGSIGGFRFQFFPSSCTLYGWCTKRKNSITTQIAVLNWPRGCRFQFNFESSLFRFLRKHLCQFSVVPSIFVYIWTTSLLHTFLVEYLLDDFTLSITVLYIYRIF